MALLPEGGPTPNLMEVPFPNYFFLLFEVIAIISLFPLPFSTGLSEGRWCVSLLPPPSPLQCLCKEDLVNQIFVWLLSLNTPPQSPRTLIILGRGSV